MANFGFTVKQILAAQEKAQPTEGIIFGIDGDRIDVRIRNSSVILRHVRVVGNIHTLALGQLISLRWEAGRPIAIAIPGTGEVPVIAYIRADDDTIENSALGLRVKRHGVRPWHLSFVPSMEGHTHMDSLQRNGWTVDDDGAIYRENTYIHSSGQLSLGAAPEVMKLDSMHATHRFWVGAVEPTTAPFSITKEGAMKATSGSIAGWDILSDRLSKNSAEILATGQIKLGTGENLAVLSSVDPNGYRLWIGSSTPASAPFRVKETGETWITNAHFYGNLESNNYVHDLAGWKIDQTGWAEFNNLQIRGKVTSLVFERKLATAVAGQQIFTDGDILASDVGTSDTSIKTSALVFQAKDIIHFVQGDRSEWMSVASDGSVDETGVTYMVERDLEGTGTSIHYTGETAVRIGSATFPSGSDENVFGSTTNEMGELVFSGGSASVAGGYLVMEGDREFGPYLKVVRRYGPIYDQLNDVVKIGKLGTFAGFSSEEYGIGIGDSLQYLMYDAVNGLRIRTRSGATSFDDNGLATDVFTLTGSDMTAKAYVTGEAHFHYDLATNEVYIKKKSVAGVYNTIAIGSAGGVFATSGAKVNGHMAVWSGTDGTRIEDGGAIPVLPVKATGAEITTGTNDTKFATPKAIADAGIIAVVAADDTTAGIVELATAGEVNVGTATNRAVTPEAFNNSNQGIRYAELACVEYGTYCEVATGVAYFLVPTGLAGMNLIFVHANAITNSAGGAMTIQIRNTNGAAWMLSTPITIDSGETRSNTSAVPAVIDTANDDVASYNLLRIDVQSVGTTPHKGLIVTMGFRKP